MTQALIAQNQKLRDKCVTDSREIARVLCPNEFATDIITAKYIPFSIECFGIFYFDRLIPYIARGIFSMINIYYYIIEVSKI